MLLFGVVGYFFDNLQINAAPLVMVLILGLIIDFSLRRTPLASQGDPCARRLIRVRRSSVRSCWDQSCTSCSEDKRVAGPGPLLYGRQLATCIRCCCQGPAERAR
jgi:hypothetical protein